MKYGEKDEEKYRCKKCGKRLRIYEDLGQRFCGDCAPAFRKIPAEMPLDKIREYFYPPGGSPL